MEKESGYLYFTISLLIKISEGTETRELNGLVRRFAIYAGQNSHTNPHSCVSKTKPAPLLKSPRRIRERVECICEICVKPILVFPTSIIKTPSSPLLKKPHPPPPQNPHHLPSPPPPPPPIPFLLVKASPSHPSFTPLHLLPRRNF